MTFKGHFQNGVLYESLIPHYIYIYSILENIHFILSLSYIWDVLKMNAWTILKEFKIFLFFHCLWSLKIWTLYKMFCFKQFFKAWKLLSKFHWIFMTESVKFWKENYWALWISNPSLQEAFSIKNIIANYFINGSMVASCVKYISLKRRINLE